MTVADWLLVAGALAIAIGVHILLGPGAALITIGAGAIYAASRLYRANT